MCYFLYGCINEQAYDELFLSISRKYGYVDTGRINIRDMYFDPRIKDGVYFRLFDGHCDCGTPLGGGDEKSEELQQYIKWLRELKKCRKHGLKYFYIMKFWEGHGHKPSLKPLVSINVDELDPVFLAGMEEDRVYRFEYFKRYEWKDGSGKDDAYNGESS